MHDVGAGIQRDGIALSDKRDLPVISGAPHSCLTPGVGGGAVNRLLAAVAAGDIQNILYHMVARLEYIVDEALLLR